MDYTTHFSPLYAISAQNAPIKLFKTQHFPIKIFSFTNSIVERRLGFLIPPPDTHLIGLRASPFGCPRRHPANASRQVGPKIH